MHGLVSVDQFKVKVFVGANQKNAPLTMARTLQSTSIEAIPLVRVMNSRSLPERVVAVIDYLKRRQVGRPRTVKTLGSSIRTQFGGQMSDDEVSKMIAALTKQGAIAIDDGKVVYSLPE